MQYAPSERRGRRKVVIDMQRIHIASDLDEPLDVVVGKRLRERDVLPDFEVVDTGGEHGAIYSIVVV